MISIPFSFDVSQLNTGLILVASGVIWRSFVRINDISIAVLGIKGKGGLVDDVKELVHSKQELEKSVVALNGAVVELQKFRLTVESIVAMRRQNG